MKEVAWLKCQLKNKVFALLCLFLLALATPVFAAQKITNYSAQIKVNTDSSIFVNETLEYDFGTEKIDKIEKKMPTLIKSGSATYRVIFSDFNALDDKGSILPVVAKYSADQITLEISANKSLFAGTKIFYLSYRVSGAIRAGSSQDTFVWPVNGSGWGIGIATISAQVSLPNNIKQENIATSCVFGAIGSQKDCSIENKDNNGNLLINYYAPNLLYAGDLFTINFSLPKGIITYPSGWRQVTVFADSNMLIAVPILVFLFGLWFVVHRNNKHKQRQAYSLRYNPPHDLSPLEMAYLLKGDIDRFDISAQVFEAAIKGYLKIGVDYSQGAGSYALYKQRQNFALPNDFDNLIFNSMFDGGEAVYMVIWRNDLLKIMPLITESVRNSLIEKSYISKNNYLLNVFVLLLNAGLSFVGWWLGNSFMPTTINQLSLAAVGPIIFLLYLLFKRSAKNSSVIQDEITGFINFLKSKDLKDPNSRDALTQANFDEYLPYAMISGQAKNWLMHFADVNFAQPNWFIDPAWQDKTYSPYLLIEDLYNFRQVLNDNK